MLEVWFDRPTIVAGRYITYGLQETPTRSPLRDHQTGSLLCIYILGLAGCRGRDEKLHVPFILRCRSAYVILLLLSCGGFAAWTKKHPVLFFFCVSREQGSVGVFCTYIYLAVLARGSRHDSLVCAAVVARYLACLPDSRNVV